MSILSFSDIHSVNFHRIGREAKSILLHKLNYRGIILAIPNNKIFKTYEFKPAAGKYYYDGHRAERHQNHKEYLSSPRRNIIKCPVCNQSLMYGVLNRCYELSDNKDNNPIRNFQNVVPLLTLIKEILGVSEYSIKNRSIYNSLVRKNQAEFNI
ncbi:MAG: hypothetical protein GF383_14870 [Candidatus Lokiarchaeota archaeon]|nr:hypothetical protein [Candidatus Lokiarchaeota archaeon]MBD3342698.1 hypothetical protein [Candidatus Lokiarchaeota archaeon]